MTKVSIKTAILEKYDGLNLLEIEAAINDLAKKHKQSPNVTNANELTAARYALQRRQRTIKAAVMEFENTNTRYLLFFNSTHGFVKLASRSALFFATTIADRIHWRYSLKSDTDRYSPSEDGVISFRSLEKVHDRLAEINIFPDSSLETPEFHYYKLDKVYSEDKISQLRDRAHHDLKRIMTIALPVSPIPSLYDAITQSSQLVYSQFKHLSDDLARDTIGQRMILITYQMSAEYMKYARAKNRNDRDSLRKIIELSRELRSGIAYASHIQILHHRDAYKVLEPLIAVERIAAKAYLRKD